MSGKISQYTEALSVANDDFFDVSIDTGGGVYATRKVRKSNLGIGGSPLTTKGDLYTYDSADARLGVGSDGQALIADSAEATGLRWGTVSADNMATADLTLTGDRTHDLNGNDLTINGTFLGTPRTAFKVTDVGAVEVLNSTTDRGLLVQAGGVTNNHLKLYAANNAEYIKSNNTLRILAQNVQTAMFSAKRMSLNSTTLPIPSTLHIKGEGSTSATTSLLVENSSGTDLFKIDDSGGFALGSGATYSDYRNISIGSGATATGISAIAIGDGATATIQEQIAIGLNANGGSGANIKNITIGDNTTNGQYGVAIGSSADGGQYSVAIGWNAEATSQGGVSVGYNTESSGNGTCIGNSSYANGYTTALGYKAKANTNQSGLAVGSGAISDAFGTMTFYTGYLTQTRTNSTSNSAEFYLGTSTIPTFRFGNTVDGWLNSTGGFVFGATSVDSSAALQVDSTTKGFLPPRMTTTEKNAISTPASGLVVYDSTLNKLCVYTGASWETVTSA